MYLNLVFRIYHLILYIHLYVCVSDVYCHYALYQIYMHDIFRNFFLIGLDVFLARYTVCGYVFTVVHLVECAMLLYSAQGIACCIRKLDGHIHSVSVSK